MRIPLLTLIAAAGFLVGSAPASAAELSWTTRFEAPILLYSAAPGEANRVLLQSTGDEIRVRDSAPLTHPADCRREAADVVCRSPGERFRVVVRLGDRDDRLTIGGTPFRVEARGGSGDDRLSSSAASAELRGDTGDDLVIGGPGSDSLTGDAGDDRVSGRAGPDYIRGDQGKDSLAGGAGDDELQAGDYWYDPVVPDARDRVRCDDGKDVANLMHGDPEIDQEPRRSRDLVHDDCESVWIGLGQAPLELLDPPLAAGRLRFYVPCVIALSSPNCSSRVSVRTPDGGLVGTDRRPIPGGRSALVGITQTALGRRLARSRRPFTVRVTVSVFEERTSTFALRVHP